MKPSCVLIVSPPLSPLVLVHAAPCSLHDHNTAVCYSMLSFQHTLSYYVLPFFFFLPPLSLTPSPSLLFLPLSSSLAFMYPDLQLGGEREQEKERERERGREGEREREREREEVTCISGVGTVCKLPCELKSRKMH